ncbi:hypothetical protein B0T20DRAFT_408760 [Sordaria brevicollis]|uniref:Uncharacterized protein n=1 Tax=Sordaria brevicollis TaxID=83679 RepID=A0AAE0UCE2_SORBR|nr:hypothetical protein B0T20DRAFT_408760 [Sordaria brevicollis]
MNHSDTTSNPCQEIQPRTDLEASTHRLQRSIHHPDKSMSDDPQNRTLSCQSTASSQTCFLIDSSANRPEKRHPVSGHEIYSQVPLDAGTQTYDRHFHLAATVFSASVYRRKRSRNGVPAVASRKGTMRQVPCTVLNKWSLSWISALASQGFLSAIVCSSRDFAFEVSYTSSLIPRVPVCLRQLHKLFPFVLAFGIRQKAKSRLEDHCLSPVITRRKERALTQDTRSLDPDNRWSNGHGWSVE